MRKPQGSSSLIDDSGSRSRSRKQRPGLIPTTSEDKDRDDKRKAAETAELARVREARSAAHSSGKGRSQDGREARDNGRGRGRMGPMVQRGTAAEASVSEAVPPASA